MKRLFIAVIAAFAIVPATAGATTLTIINHTHLSKHSLRNAEDAVLAQINHEVHGAWGTANIRFGRGGERIYLQSLNSLGNCGCLGYHDVGNNGVPYARIGVGGGYSWTDTFSHEVAEMTVDPYISHYITAFVPYALPGAPNGANVQWLVEVGDPVEDFGYYGKHHVLLTDFSKPAWYEGPSSAGPWDYSSLLPGSYYLSSPSGFAYFMYQGSYYQVTGTGTGRLAQARIAKRVGHLSRANLCLTCIPRNAG